LKRAQRRREGQKVKTERTRKENEGEKNKGEEKKEQGRGCERRAKRGKEKRERNLLVDPRIQKTQIRVDPEIPTRSIEGQQSVHQGDGIGEGLQFATPLLELDVGGPFAFQNDFLDLGRASLGERQFFC
jgi:hypothetical protein